MLKRFIRKVQLDVQGLELENAKEVVSLLKEQNEVDDPKSSYSDASTRFVTQTFFHVKPNDIDKVTKYIIETIKSTQDFHSIRSIGAMDVNKLMKKSLSYFHCFYVDGNFLTSENVLWMEEWEVEVLVPNNITFIHEIMLDAFDEDDWDQFGANGDYLFVMYNHKNN